MDAKFVKNSVVDANNDQNVSMDRHLLKIGGWNTFATQ